MGLRIIYGKAGCGKSSFCFSEISKLIKTDEKIFIVTPEQFSFTAEKKLMECVNQNESRTKIKQETLFTNLINRVKKITKEEELKVEKREVTKDDKKAIIITIAIILGLGLLLWILPFTHQFMEDFLFLRF